MTRTQQLGSPETVYLMRFPYVTSGHVFRACFQGFVPRTCLFDVIMRLEATQRGRPRKAVLLDESNKERSLL